jgi:hypothetical protein
MKCHCKAFIFYTKIRQYIYSSRENSEVVLVFEPSHSCRSLLYTDGLRKSSGLLITDFQIKSRVCSMQREKISMCKTVIGMPQWKIPGDPIIDRMMLLKCILGTRREDLD